MNTRIFSRNVPSGETLTVGLLLALAGGALDAYTFMFRGGVFANAQTGNIALLGISIAGRNWMEMVYDLLPIAAYFAGVFLTEIFKRKFTEKKVFRWEYIILLCEIMILFALGFVPGSVSPILCTVPISFVCSLQTNSFRKLRGAAYATTMCTGNLRSAAEDFYLFVFLGDQSAKRACGRYFLIILAFSCGAFIGAVCVYGFGQYAVWICCAILISAFGISMLRDAPSPQEPANREQMIDDQTWISFGKEE